MASRLMHIGEFGFIERIKKNLRVDRTVVKGIGDDAAVIRYSRDKALLMTTDMLIEDVHFTRQTPPLEVGHKAMACSISDIAAMGGEPRYAMVSVGLPRALRLDWIEAVYRGMETAARRFGVSIVGGDTVQSRRIVINIALTGEARLKHLVLRSGAKSGDHIFVTGPLGGSYASGRHLTFTPRVKEAQYLVKNFHPTAMIDVSDGLAADLGHILEQSRAGAVIEECKIPCHPDAASSHALYDGEDFELIFTLPPVQAKRLLAMKRGCPVFYPIGIIVPRVQGFQILNEKGERRRLKVKGYQHF